MKSTSSAPEGGSQEAARRFLAELLEGGALDALLVPAESEPGRISQILASSPGDLGNAVPLSPVISGAPIPTVVSWMAEVGVPKQRLGVVIKPCESRLLVELAKFKQAWVEGLYIIGVDCTGTYHVLEAKEMADRGVSPVQEVIKSLESGAEDEAFRDACRICITPRAPVFDLNIAVIGKKQEGGMSVEIGSEKGQKALEAIGWTAEYAAERQELRSVVQKRKAKRRDYIEQAQEELRGYEGLERFFEDCIGCNNCMEVCPICFCKECFFDADRYEFVTSRFLQWDSSQGTLPTLESKIQFHLGRAIHMSTSCIACGLCEQACPKDIKLNKLFGLLAEENQALFDYQPGMSLKEAPPVQEFMEEELAQFVGSAGEV